MDPVTILSAFAPVLVDGVKAGINKYLGDPKESFKPASVDEAVALHNAEIEKLKALYNLGSDAETYKWVEAIRKLQRPVVIVTALGAWVYVHAAGMADTSAVDNMAAAIGFYLFGDRSMFYIRKARGK